jgi:hypothetical protein
MPLIIFVDFSEKVTYILVSPISHRLLSTERNLLLPYLILVCILPNSQ